MELISGVILGLIVLTLLVVAHELGHAITARRNGVVVEEFGVGFPPKAWSKKIKKSWFWRLREVWRFMKVRYRGCEINNLLTLHIINPIPIFRKSMFVLNFLLGSRLFFSGEFSNLFHKFSGQFFGLFCRDFFVVIFLISNRLSDIYD